MPPRHAKAIAHLTAADPVLGRWIAEAGPCSLSRERSGTHFGALARSIIYQQLSGKAAATIHGRFCALFDDEEPDPRVTLKLPLPKLRAVGLSERKAEYLRGLAEDVHRDRLPLARIESMPDDEVIAALTQVRGIGEWTAQMFLMFRLGRPDVLPTLDLGVQTAIRRLYGLRKHPAPRRVATIGAKWAPYRTVASWYLWRVVDDPPQ
ncbi:MAG: DNA-3-methyladenine glycosylase 2 family protein [Gemmatimonadaceae bacterium]|nr:DNA-3-methyladenine glycosylase 2 family protein [Gemmatimonadaceae bacterium]MCW5827130.1 DNA-3-methyladenine glycosylase 2 family protein [Gemmatimonadaceae bacterium]